MNEIIHCIGDSHAGFFSGHNFIQPSWPAKTHNAIPLFRAYRLGAVLAYNLKETGTTAGGHEKLLTLLEVVPKGSNIVMCFGEIDCRVHLVKQSVEQNRPLKDVVTECVERYFSVLKDLKKDFHVIAWAVVPSTPSKDVVDKRYPHFGSNIERNTATVLFNQKLKELCDKEKIDFISIFNLLVNDDGSTKKTMFADKVHLSQKAMPYSIKEFKHQIPNLNVRLFYGLLGRLPFSIQYFIFSLKSELGTLLFIWNKKIRTLIKNIVRR